MSRGMDAQQIYSALFNPRGPVKEARGEWLYVGDGQHIEESRLQSILAESITSPKAYIAVSRLEARYVARASLHDLAESFLSQGDVRVADSELRNFVEISRLGVARAWRSAAYQTARADGGEIKRQASTLACAPLSSTVKRSMAQ
jgi:hypothetical protein